MSDDKQQQRRQVPQNELDLALMTTDSVWGKPEVNETLKTVLNKYYKTKNEEGKEGYTVQSLWGLLGFYTRDIRLANLNMAQLEYVRHYLDLAGDCLQEGLVKAFIIALSRGATMLELSQSKGGFLRKRQGTLTQESFHQEKEPPKRRFFSGKKNNGGYYNE